MTALRRAATFTLYDQEQAKGHDQDVQAVRACLAGQGQGPNPMPEPAVQNALLEQGEQAVKCDHAKVQTPFCPSCGQALEVSPATLLRYLRSQQEKLGRWTEDLRARSNGSDRYLELARRKQKTVDKWTRWADWVEQKMGSTE